MQTEVHELDIDLLQDDLGNISSQISSILGG
jgi:hypothetical protein